MFDRYAISILCYCTGLTFFRFVSFYSKGENVINYYAENIYSMQNRWIHLIILQSTNQKIWYGETNILTNFI